MKLKKLLSKILWINNIKWPLGIIGSVGTAFTISGTSTQDFYPIENCVDWIITIFTVLLTFLLFWVISAYIAAKRADKGIFLKIRGIKVVIKKGDIFESKDLKLIPFNEYFDTKVDDVVIARNSLNGEFIKGHANIEDLQETIKQAEEIPNLKSREKDGRRKFPLGRIIRYNDYMLLSFSHFINKQASLSQNEYESCLRTMWDEISRVYANQPITLPLIGGGITRFTDVSEKNPTYLLRCILWTLETSNAQINQPITIVLPEKTIENINLYEIKNKF